MLLRRLLDGVSPDALLALISARSTRYPVLFDSVSSGPMSKHSVLVATDGDSLALRRDGVLCRNGVALAAQSTGFLDALERWWSALRVAAESEAPGPWRGGFAVFAGYELAAEVEPRLQLPQSEEPWRAFALRTPAALVHERGSNAVWAVAETGAAHWLDLLEQDARAASESPLPQSAPATPAWQVTEDDPERYLDGARRALQHIAAGDVYQLNLSRGWRAALPAVPGRDQLVPALYAALRRANPAPFAVLARWNGLDILSSSPERLLRVEAGIASTRPIAGTRPRGGSESADEALAAELRSNAKERAEHVMLIDLERNDVGRVCRAGTVGVDEFMALETYTHVHHIVSQISGELRSDAHALDAFRALFPGGTITGCPKVRCMELIARIEAGGRGAYTGSLGMLGLDGSADFNILIRTLTVHDGHVHARAGAGIVADSQPQRELDETRAKALGLLRALELCGQPAPALGMHT
jgi:anthranilate synthase component 1